MAIDLGASSGRVFLGQGTAQGFTLREIHRFPNRPRPVDGVLRWDAHALFSGILDGLRAAGADGEWVDAVSVDGWGAQRAAVYGVPEDELGAFYARRTLLKQEVLPEHVAAAVLALCAGDLPLTTGLLIPVDAGVAAAFLR